MRYFITFILLLGSAVSFGQDARREKGEKKYRIYVGAGLPYKNFFGKKYIEPTVAGSAQDFSLHQYERFTRIPCWGFREGLMFSYSIYHNWYLVSGILYYHERNIYEADCDTVIRYNSIGYPTSFYNILLPGNIHNVVKYNYVYDGILMPLKVHFKKAKFNFYGGVNYSPVTFKKSTYTYVSGIVSYSPLPVYDCANITEKTVKSIELSAVFSPSFMVSYDFKIRNLFLNPFLGFDFGKQKSFNLQSGIAFPLANSSEPACPPQK